MPDLQYGESSQTPSSRPPEPPFGVDLSASPANPPAVSRPASNPTMPIETPAPQAETPVQQVGVPADAAYANSSWAPQAKPDTRGIDLPGDIPAAGAYQPMGSPDKTESFQTARFGDTGALPRVEAAQQPPTYDARQRYDARSYTSAAAAPKPAQAAHSAKAAKGGGGGGKSFLFGFLGALLACALAFGGFYAFGGFSARTQATSALVGTTDQSVINAVDEGQTLAEAVAAKALPSVVAVYNYQDASSMYGYGYGYGYGTQGSDNLVATGMGSGVVISDDGYILTNYHVVENAAKLTVTVDGIERDATYVGGDSSSDVAVVKVENTEGLKPADIGDSDKLVIGEWVMTVGAPLGLEQSVATGVVSATNRDTVMSNSSSSDPYSQIYGQQGSQDYTYYPNMIQTDAVINPGNSGGALVDADGKLIGINTMISSYSGDYAGVGFAIPVNYAISIAQDIIDGKEPTHAMLGVSLSQVNSQIAQRYNLSADKGAYISAITPDTGAAESDLQVGDIITAIDGKNITSVTDVTLNVRAHKVGDTVKVTVNRSGETLDVEVKLTSDENVAKAQDTGQNQQDMQEMPDMQDFRDQRGDGGGGFGGMSDEQLEELLKMLGM